MKRKLAILTTTVFVLFSLTGIGQAQGLSFKLSGGYGTMTVGDFNTVIEDLDSLYASGAALMGLTKEGELKGLKYGLDLEGEFVVKLIGGVGIGVGAGYILRSKDSEFRIEDVAFGEMSGSLEPEFTAVPVTLSFYYFLPSGPLVNIYLNGGVGYYFGKAKFTYREEYDYIDPITLIPVSGWDQISSDAKDQGVGVHGGLGVEFSMGSNIGLFIEGKGRYCKLKSWEGDGTMEEDGDRDVVSGTVWYFEDPVLGSQFMISEEKPDWSGIENVRKLEWDLSGLSIRVGIRIKF